MADGSDSHKNGGGSDAPNSTQLPSSSSHLTGEVTSAVPFPAKPFKISLNVSNLDLMTTKKEVEEAVRSFGVKDVGMVVLGLDEDYNFMGKCLVEVGSELTAKIISEKLPGMVLHQKNPVVEVVRFGHPSTHEHGIWNEGSCSSDYDDAELFAATLFHKIKSSPYVGESEQMQDIENRIEMSRNRK